MSRVTTVILITDVGEDDPEDQPETCIVTKVIDAWLVANNQGPFRLLNEHFGGIKNPECRVWGFAANYLHLEDFCRLVFAQKWAWPEDVQVLIQIQEMTSFAMLRSMADWKPEYGE